MILIKWMKIVVYNDIAFLKFIIILCYIKMDNDIEFLEDGNTLLAWKDLLTMKVVYQKAYISTIFSENFCNEIINNCELVAHNNLNNENIDKRLINSEGWINSCTYGGKYIINIGKLNQNIQSKINNYIEKLYHDCSAIYNLNPKRIKLKFADIIKYTCNIKDSQVKLSEHADGGQITFNIQLNKKIEYSGGGIKFSKPFQKNNTFRLNQGEFICHAAKQKHQALEITKGIRYVLTIFTHVENTVFPDNLNDCQTQ